MKKLKRDYAIVKLDKEPKISNECKICMNIREK